jgi:pimeloyl-ACP methyl ester carboxylesterase
VAAARAWAPPRLRSRVIAMRRRAFELQRGEGEEAADPPDAGFPAVDFPVRVAAGECDLPDFRAGSFAAALGAPLELIPNVGHLAPIGDRRVFRALLLRFVA